jgi:TPR repeat protein
MSIFIFHIKYQVVFIVLIYLVVPGISFCHEKKSVAPNSTETCSSKYVNNELCSAACEDAKIGGIDSYIRYGDLIFFSDCNYVSKQKDAVYWYMKAAENGSLKALHRLGNLYSAGITVEKDVRKAKMYYLKASRNNYISSFIPLAELIYKTAKTEKDLCDALYWYGQAINHNSDIIPSIYTMLEERMVDKCK